MNRPDEDLSIGIVGYGFVGKAMSRLFGKAAVFDPVQGIGTKESINRCRFAFVCVPTPPRATDGAADTSIVEEVVEWIDPDRRGTIIVLRSTVPPGTTDRLRKRTGKPIIFQPEYIGETVAHPLLDHHAQGFSILGGDRETASQVADLYKRLFHANHRFFFTDAATAELAKYMENAFYAVKVTFCNEFFDIARRYGVDFNVLREAWLCDPRISRDHTFVYPEDRGFGGKCLPKDVSAIIAAVSAHGWSRPELLDAVMKINARHRRADPDYRPFLELSRGPQAP